MFANIGFWSLILNALVLIVSVSGFIKIMRNDLFHLEKDTKEIKKILSEISSELCKNGERIATLEGKCSARTNC